MQSEETHAMKKTIGVMDKEKDFLQETVDEKTEKIANLQESLLSKVCIRPMLLASQQESLVSLHVKYAVLTTLEEFLRPTALPVT